MMASPSAAASSAGDPAPRTRCIADWRTKSVPIATPGDAIRPVQRISDIGALLLFSSIIEIALDQLQDSAHSVRRLIAVGPEVKGTAVRCLHRHHLHDALSVDPRALSIQGDLDLSGEGLRQHGELQGRPCMKTGGMSEESPACGDAHCGESSSAVFFTSASEAPLAASAAAITAPSTIGSFQMTTFLWRSSSRISTAISLLVSAPPRSTRIATPESDHALSIASMIAGTLVPKPPSGLPPVQATGTSAPTICRTMSAAPSATLGEWETITMPTFALMRSPGNR